MAARCGSPTSRRASISSAARSARRSSSASSSRWPVCRASRIRFRPTHDYGQPTTERALGSSHIRYAGGDTALRLTTDAPLSYIDREASFVLNRPLHLAFGSDTPFEGALEGTCREFVERTRDYWLEWVRRLGVSYDWQEATMRAAITLKLSNFEETGAIIAAHTTSIPEAPGSGRTWDYRYCWLRDAYFVVQALNRIGATRTMEQFISYILTIASVPSETLRPVYSVVSSDPMEERIVESLKGYRGDGPVRIGNEAAMQDQHDTYGSIILAAAPMFFDRRLPRMGDADLFHRLEPLGEKAAALAMTPDAGIWEFRGRKRMHVHSAAMCWAGCQRLEAIAAHLGLADRAQYWGSNCRQNRRGTARKSLESEAEGLHRRDRFRRARRQRSAAARPRPDRTKRSAIR